MLRGIVLGGVVGSASACTTVAFGTSATQDGSTMVTYNADSNQLDYRVAYIPPADHEPGSQKPIYKSEGNYPRFVGDTAETYKPVEVKGVKQSISKPIGFIPEVAHTYGYWETAYPFMNEKGLVFGETTVWGKIRAKSRAPEDGGKALFYVDWLMTIAAQRCDTARCAVETMGYWGEKEGFYGEDPNPSEGGEVITVADASEAWVFHIMADFDGSAVWAAQRVPDNHGTVAANNFIIRKVDFSDESHSNYMWSSNILKVAGKLMEQGEAAPECVETDTFDFLKCFGADLNKDWYDPGYGARIATPWYTTMRMWRVQNLTGTGWLQPSDNPFELPFSFPVRKPVTLETAMAIMRDKLEGTAFDLTKGAVAGPYGDPNRVEGGQGMVNVPGIWPRAISLMRTNYGIVGHLKKNAPAVTWLAPHQPATAVYVPFFAEATACHESYMKSSQLEYDRTAAWWVFGFLSNWMRTNWRDMSTNYVFPKRDEMQAALFKKVSGITTDFTQMQVELQGSTVQAWSRFSDFMVQAYFNGLRNFPEVATKYGYPEDFLRSIGFSGSLLPLQVTPLIDNKIGRASLAEAEAPSASQSLFGLVAGVVIGVGGTVLFFHARSGSAKIANQDYGPLTGA